MDVRELMAELSSATCRCGKPKRMRETFCNHCYRTLPPPMRRALYRLVGEGYEEAYAAAVEHLGAVPA